MFTRRQVLFSLFTGAVATKTSPAWTAGGHTEAHHPPAGSPRPTVLSGATYKPVVTPNGSALPWVMKNGVKEFHLVAEPVVREFAPGMTVQCWGYNGQTPGPTIETVEGDRVRILVTNRLPEHTSVHWHGILLPNGMDGVGGLTQPHIKPGETWVYEFSLHQNGTFMYHPHASEMLQLAVGMMGFFIVHPKKRTAPAVDRDYAIMLHEWAIHPGTYRPDPSVMLDFNTFTFNSKVFPATDPLLARTGDRMRIRLANLSMHEHPIHIHGHHFFVTGTDGGRVQESARLPESTVLVPVGSTRDVEFVAERPGDWAFHCHKSHHTMNAMGHDLPNLLGVSQKGLEEKIRAILPGYMAMGETGMADHAAHLAHVPGPQNTLPMMTGQGPFGAIEMGGMFTIIKIREDLDDDGTDPGWYQHPDSTLAYRLK